jgi:DHA2 family multidrug resistance protein
VSLVGLLWWQLSERNTHPVIQLRVLKNRNLAASILLFIILGFGLFGGAILFPLFTQSVLGFTPTETGLAMLPGGLATAAVAVVCGFLLNGDRPKADARVLILLGMALMLWSMWDLGHLTSAAGEVDARHALIIRGAALGLLFTPINNVAFGSLEPQEAQQASGLINLSRQLGGSFGIAVLGTYLTRHTQYHRADLVQNFYAGNPAFEERFRMLVTGFQARGRATRRGAAARLRGARRHDDEAGRDAGVQRLVAVHPGVVPVRDPGRVPPAEEPRRGRRRGRRALTAPGASRQGACGP